MAGTTPQGAVIPAMRQTVHGRLLYRLAEPEDEADLRELLRAQPLPGWVSLAFTREPNYFAGAALEGERHAVILARDRDTGCLAGMFSRGVRRVYLNGESRWLPYLGQLRVASAHRGGYHRLRQGFELARQWLRAPDELPFELTSILADNRAARRLLTAGLPGMPRYAPLGELVTLASGGTSRSASSGRGDRRSSRSAGHRGLSAPQSSALPACASLATGAARRYRRLPRTR